MTYCKSYTVKICLFLKSRRNREAFAVWEQGVPEYMLNTVVRRASGHCAMALRTGAYGSFHVIHGEEPEPK